MMHCLYDMQYESFLHCDHFLRGMDAAERQYLAAFIAGGMSSIARTYVRTGCRAGEAELESLMYRLFGGDYLASPGA